MEGLELRVQDAQGDTVALDTLLRDYLPFLKKQAARSGYGLDYDDRLSLAMLAFTGAVRQYTPSRGAFLPFVEVCIRNRLLDETRREMRYSEHVVPIADHAGALAAPDALGLAVERQGLSDEITEFAGVLSEYGVCLQDLEQCCPKQRRARSQCLALAACLSADVALRDVFLRDGRLPHGELARRFSLSVKTVEKHRKYIVALAVLLLGDFPGIRAFLPKGDMAGERGELLK